MIGVPSLHHLLEHGDGEELGVADDQRAHERHRRGEAGVGHHGGVDGQPALGEPHDRLGGVHVHRQRADHRAVVVVDDRPLGVGLLAAGDELAELDDLAQVVHVGCVAAHRLEAVLERRVEPAQAELPLGSVVGQRGDAEDVEPGQLVDEVRDVGDVARRRAPLDARDGVDDIGRRRAGDDDRPIVGDGAVVPGVATAEREARRRHLAVLLHDLGGEAHGLAFDDAAVLLEDLARGREVGEDAHRLEDFERGLVRAPDLRVREQLDVPHAVMPPLRCGRVRPGGLRCTP